MQNKNPYQVAAYYFPSYHADPRREQRYGKGWNEWELMRKAKPRFPGHQQPKIPAWGYEDESIPANFAKKIDAAADHGLGAFLFDWYWYEGSPYLAARAGGRLSQSAECEEGAVLPDVGQSRLGRALPRALRQGRGVDFSRRGRPTKEFERVANYVVEKYFTQPGSWTIDGCPYFSIYEMGTFLRGFGSVKETRKALDYFREITRKAGFPDLHLNMVVTQVPNLPSETVVPDPGERLNELGVDSLTSYAWIHHSSTSMDSPRRHTPRRWPTTSAHGTTTRSSSSPIFPASRWAGIRRRAQSRTSRGKTSVIPTRRSSQDNTPAEFQGALESAKAFLKQHPESKKYRDDQRVERMDRRQLSRARHDRRDGLPRGDQDACSRRNDNRLAGECKRKRTLNPPMATSHFPKIKTSPLRRTGQQKFARVQALQPAREVVNGKTLKDTLRFSDRVLALVPRRRLRSVRSRHDRALVGKGRRSDHDREAAHGRGLRVLREDRGAVLLLPRPRHRAGRPHARRVKPQSRQDRGAREAAPEGDRREAALGHGESLFQSPLYVRCGDESRCARLRLRRCAGEKGARGDEEARRREFYVFWGGREGYLEDAAQHEPEARAGAIWPGSSTWRSITPRRSASRASS